MSAFLLVEGESDQIAIETLAERRGVELGDVEVVALGGAHRIGKFVGALDPDCRVRLIALCDAAEEPVFRRVHDFGSALHVCVKDLEDELIRALGVAAVEEVVRAAGDLRRLRALQQMPQWRARSVDEQIHRFIAAGANRKIRYARLLVEALDLDQVPRPLDGVLLALA